MAARYKVSRYIITRTRHTYIGMSFYLHSAEDSHHIRCEMNPEMVSLISLSIFVACLSYQLSLDSGIPILNILLYH